MPQARGCDERTAKPLTPIGSPSRNASQPTRGTGGRYCRGDQQAPRHREILADAEKGLQLAQPLQTGVAKGFRPRDFEFTQVAQSPQGAAKFVEFFGLELGETRVSLQRDLCGPFGNLAEPAEPPLRGLAASVELVGKGREFVSARLPVPPGAPPDPLPPGLPARPHRRAGTGRGQQFQRDVAVAHAARAGGDLPGPRAQARGTFFPESWTPQFHQQPETPQRDAQLVDFLGPAVLAGLLQPAGQFLTQRAQSPPPTTMEARRIHANHRFTGAWGRMTVWLCSRRNCCT